MATEKENDQIKADAKARAKAQQEQTELDKAQKEAYRAEVEEQAGKQAVQDVVPTPAYDEAVEEYGPFPEPIVVTTPHGDFGVPFRKVLFFVETEVFDPKVNRMVMIQKNTHRMATKEEMAPILAKREQRKAALAGRAV